MYVCMYIGSDYFFVNCTPGLRYLGCYDSSDVNGDTAKDKTIRQCESYGFSNAVQHFFFGLRDPQGMCTWFRAGGFGLLLNCFK